MTGPARKFPLRHFCNRSAVAIMAAVIDGQWHLFMIKRAEREGDPWSGQMAFPGGRWEAQDTSILATARREAREEVGIDPQPLALAVTRQSDVLTRSHRTLTPQVVTPFLFTLAEAPTFAINHEAAQGLWIPAALFTARPSRLRWRVGPLRVPLPCHYHQGQPIWGLSLMIIRDLKRRHPTLFAGLPAHPSR